MRSDPIRRGHFILESGLHTDVWLELDQMFLNPSVLETQVNELAGKLGQHDITAVCGPLIGGAFVAQSIAAKLNLRFYYTSRVSVGASPELFGATYRVPEGLRSHAIGERFAVVDDAISAGSSTRATLSDLSSIGAQTVVVGALLLLGDTGARYFANLGIPVVAAAHRGLSLWEPQSCPLCQAGVAFERRH